MNVYFLGTGSGEGIPVIGCECRHCEIARKMGGKFERKRTAILLEDNNTKILIEAPPDIYSEIRDFEIDEINILVSHSHLDHCVGIIEFKNSPDPVNFYVEKSVLYLMEKNKITDDDLKRKFNIVKLDPFEKFKIDEIEIFYFPVPHVTQTFGIYFNVNNKKVVYSSDMENTRTFSKASLEVFKNVDLAIINTPIFEPPKYDHMTTLEALEFVKRSKIKKAVLTHISHKNMPYNKLCEFVMKNNKNVIVSYDGMKIKI